MLAKNSTCPQVDKTENNPAKKTTFARSDSLFSTLATCDTRNLFQSTGELTEAKRLYFSSQVTIPTIPLKPSRYTLRKDDTLICHVWKFCKDLTFGHVLFTDLYHHMRIFHALINLSINCFPNTFLSDSVKITWCVFNKTMYYNYQCR